MEHLTRTARSRTQILDAAEQLFRERGFGKTSVDDVAVLAGLTRKTVYNHFENKELLGRKLIERVEAAPAALYQARLDADEPARAILSKVLSDSAQWCVANPGLAHLALAPEQRPTVEPPADRPSFQGLVRDVLRHGQKQSVVRSDKEASDLALFVLAIYSQAMLSALAETKPCIPDLDNLIALVFEGIA
ncbi:TetR/AcrR family transcriptional regulator [Rhodophyticola sp. CCM32]|nr:TetR/AcrR family transcriptional regulator [Rhodophyticola sp. CCM32]